MKKIFLGLLALSMFAVSCKNDESKTDTKDSAGNATPEAKSDKKLTPEEEMQAWMAYSTPGEVHQMLAKSNGTWTCDGQSWMNPDSPAIKYAGSAVNKMILGGRYQESVHTGTMMGGPFEGRSTLGYDNAKKVFQSTWVDNMGTGVMYMEGPWDAATKSITFKGKGIDPGTGKDVDMREVFTMVDDNTHQMKMYCTKDGKEVKLMEMTMKRKM